MSDEPRQGQVPEPSTTPEAGETPNPEPTTTPQTATTTAEPPEAEPFDSARAMETIRKQRDAEKAAKDAQKAAERQRDELQARLKALEDEKLTEQERKDKQYQETAEALAKVEAERAQRDLDLQEIRTQRAVEKLAARALKEGDDVKRPSFVDPETAFQLINRAALAFNDDGTPTDESVQAALTALAQAKPFLLQPTAQAAGGNTSTNPARANANQPHTETDAERRNRIYGLNTPSVFDPAAATQRGGGVRWVKPPE